MNDFSNVCLQSGAKTRNQICDVNYHLIPSKTFTRLSKILGFGLTPSINNRPCLSLTREIGVWSKTVEHATPSCTQFHRRAG